MEKTVSAFLFAALRPVEEKVIYMHNIAPVDERDKAKIVTAQFSVSIIVFFVVKCAVHFPRYLPRSAAKV